MKTVQPVAIRPLQKEDAAFLCSIFKDNADYYAIFFDPESSLAEWNNRVAYFLTQTRIHHFLIEVQGGPVGWLSIIDSAPSERELGIFVINKENLHRGYGTEVLSQVITECKRDNITRLSLNVNQSNTHAIQFYQKFGFEISAAETIPQCNDAVNLPQYRMELSL